MGSRDKSNNKKIVVCKNCGHPVIQSEVEENKGKCTNCGKKFKPLETPSEPSSPN